MQLKDTSMEITSILTVIEAALEKFDILDGTIDIQLKLF